MISLIEPNVEYKNQYIEMIEEWKKTEKELTPWVLDMDYYNFEDMVLKLKNFSKGIGVEKKFVPSSTFWVWNDKTDNIIGAVNIRHKLNDFLLNFGGNIGYGIRPSERKKGYATLALKMALEKCHEIGIKNKVLVCCNKENTASAKVILKNKGVLENEVNDPETNKIVQRYWIDIGR